MNKPRPRTSQDQVNDWIREMKMQKLIDDYKAGKKIKVGKPHIEELQ